MIQAKPSKGLLSGLAPTPNVSAFAKGQQMTNQAALGMENAKKQQETAVDQMQEDSQQRQRQSQNAASRAGNESQERVGAGNLANRANVFNVGMGFDYASLQKRRQLDLQQTLLNGLAREF